MAQKQSAWAQAFSGCLFGARPNTAPCLKLKQFLAACTANFSMPEVGDVFHEVFFVEAKPPEAHNIAAAQAEAVNYHPF